MTPIAPGDVVECVDVSPNPLWAAWYGNSDYATRFLKPGRFYRVAGVRSASDCRELILAGIGSDVPGRGWAEWRFRKADDGGADAELIARIKGCRSSVVGLPELPRVTTPVRMPNPKLWPVLDEPDVRLRRIAPTMRD